MSLISSSQKPSLNQESPSDTALPSLTEPAVSSTSDSTVSSAATITLTSANSQSSANPSSASISASSISMTTPTGSSVSSTSSNSGTDGSSPISSPTSSSSSGSPTTSPSSLSTISTSSSSTPPPPPPPPTSSSNSPPPPPPTSTPTSPTSTPPPPTSSPSNTSSESQLPLSTSSGSLSPPPSSSLSPNSPQSSPDTDSDTSLSSPFSPSQSSSVTVITLTSLRTTFSNGQLTTLTTTITTSSVLNFNTPATSSSTSSQHTGVVVGSAIGGTFAALLLISGIFLLYRRGFRRRATFSPLPTAPRSPPLHEQDFDLEGHSRQPSLPTLLPPRGSDTGSIFREEVWPPPNTGSRLQDPLLAASNIDLTSIVDAVMGPSHPRWSSANTSASSEPLLGRDTPDGHSIRPSTAGSNQMALGPQGSTNNPMETSPGGNLLSQQSVMNTGPSHQPITTDSSTATGEVNLIPFSGVTPGSSINFSLPPGAAPPFTPFLNRPVNRQRRRESIQTSGSPPPTEQRAERSSFGPLMVINDTPGDQDMPLVDLSPIRREAIPKDQPPLYHTLSDLSPEPLQPTKLRESSSSAAQ